MTNPVFVDKWSEEFKLFHDWFLDKIYSENLTNEESECLKKALFIMIMKENRRIRKVHLANE